jgi:hypothetical protein
VTVTVTNVDTAVTKVFTTNQSGLYDTDSIVTGPYTVTFAKDGFQKLVRGRSRCRSDSPRSMVN